MVEKKWLLKPKYPAKFAEKFPAYSGIILQLLFDRGLNNQVQIDEFMNPDYSQDLHDPFLFQDMEKAVERISTAISSSEKILIHGDYDADGITSSVLLEKTLQKLGATSVDVFIPHREEDGYGLSLDNVKKFISKKYNLVITVDCGVTNIEQIAQLNKAKIDTIVVDHHLEGDKLPPAHAILNCSLQREKYPFKKLAGVGMAFKLAQALFSRQPYPEEFEAFTKWLLDLVAIGTIGDVSPILGENRTLVTYGLKVLNKTPRLGLRELIRTCSLSNGDELKKDLPLGADLYDLNVFNVAFQIVPRLNATGRIDHADLAYKLLTTTNETEAIALARDIHEKNLTRQKLAEQMLKQARKILDQKEDDVKIQIISQSGWLSGMVGLVAGKLKDEYTLPVLVFSQDGDQFSGSGRSLPQFNITEAVSQCKEFVERSGGHSQACGLLISSRKNYDKFVKKITQIAEEKLTTEDLTPILEIDVDVTLADLNWELWDELEKFEPFAEANPLPLFLLKNVKIDTIDEVGKNGGHLKFLLSQKELSRKAISFGTAEKWKNKISAGDIVDLIVEFGVNEWNGNRELQLKVVDHKKNF